MALSDEQINLLCLIHGGIIKYWDELVPTVRKKLRAANAIRKLIYAYDTRWCRNNFAGQRTYCRCDDLEQDNYDTVSENHQSKGR